MGTRPAIGIARIVARPDDVRQSAQRSLRDNEAVKSFSKLSEQHGQVLRELNAERAAALMRIAGTLESLLAQLESATDRVARAEGLGRVRALAAYRELRAHAVKYRWYLEVQREALGIRRHDVLDEFYRIPPPLDES